MQTSCSALNLPPLSCTTRIHDPPISGVRLVVYDEISKASVSTPDARDCDAANNNGPPREHWFKSCFSKKEVANSGRHIKDELWYTKRKEEK